MVLQSLIMLVLVVFFFYPSFIKCLEETSILPRLDGKIVGGENAKIEDYPYQLSLEYRGRHICGASLIHSNWAVTAAHCTDRAKTSLFKIRAGTSLRGEEGQIVAVKKVYQHPKYSSWLVDYDVSVLSLEQPITSALRSRPVPLAHESTIIVKDSEAIITGWGTISEGGSLGNTLQVVKVPVVSQETCKKMYGRNSITERMLCAGYLGVGGKDACQGDSGGPLVINGYLTGVVSWGYGCARPNYPGVYSSIPALRGFIRATSGV